jgi:hypothetical protein
MKNREPAIVIVAGDSVSRFAPPTAASRLQGARGRNHTRKARSKFGDNEGYTCRSTIMRLISAIAFAGLRCFGQALAQFIMVWQR